MTIPKHLLNSKLISEEQWEEYQNLKKEVIQLRKRNEINIDRNIEAYKIVEELQKLCDKYEEEHKTTFIEWQKDIKANKKAIGKIQYIIDYGFDYDGLNTVESLKGLVDMLVDYAVQSKNILEGKDE